MASQQQTKYPIIAIPKDVFDILEQWTVRHERPTVNAVVQSLLGKEQRHRFLYILTDADSKPLFEDVELRRIRLTQHQFDVLRCFQAEFSSRQRYYDGAQLLVSLLWQSSPQFREELESRVSVYADGIQPDGSWSPVDPCWWNGGPTDGWFEVYDQEGTEMMATSVLL